LPFGALFRRLLFWFIVKVKDVDTKSMQHLKCHRDVVNAALFSIIKHCERSMYRKQA